MSFLRSTKGAAVLIGCLFVFGALYLAGRRTEHPLVTGSAIGSVNQLVGDADIRPARSLTFEKLRTDTQLYGGEMIVVHEASQVTLGFGQATIRLQPGARLVAEKDSSRAGGAIQATLLSGDAESLTTSPLFRLVKDGREVVGSTMSKSSSDAAVVKGARAPLPSREVVVAPTLPAETPTPIQHPTARLNDETDATSKDSLSNEEIRRAVGVQSGFYRRCYLNYLNRLKVEAPKGETVTVGFIVANSGKIREAKIVRSTVNDDVLKKCVLETVERTPFRAFKAADIPVLEFPIELK
jgi:hypothetical protein